MKDDDTATGIIIPTVLTNQERYLEFINQNPTTIKKRRKYRKSKKNKTSDIIQYRKNYYLKHKKKLKEYAKKYYKKLKRK